MNPSSTASSQAQAMVLSLRRAVRQAIDRKRRMQHYLVQWTDQGPKCIGPDAPQEPMPPRPNTP